MSSPVCEGPALSRSPRPVSLPRVLRLPESAQTQPPPYPSQGTGGEVTSDSACDGSSGERTRCSVPRLFVPATSSDSCTQWQLSPGSRADPRTRSEPHRLRGTALLRTCTLILMSRSWAPGCECKVSASRSEGSRVLAETRHREGRGLESPILGLSARGQGEGGAEEKRGGQMPHS